MTTTKTTKKTTATKTEPVKLQPNPFQHEILELESHVEMDLVVESHVEMDS